MSAFLRKLLGFFKSEETRFIQLFKEEVELKKFVDLKSIPSKVSKRKRLLVVDGFISSKKIEGVLIVKYMHFLSIKNSEYSRLKTTLKSKGTLGLSILQEKWSVKIKIINSFLQSIEKGVMGSKDYFTDQYLKNKIITTLRNVEEECNLGELSDDMQLSLTQIVANVRELINEDNITGVVKDNSIYMSADSFEELFLKHIEERISTVTELSFSDIANALGVLDENIETYIMKHVKENPNLIVVYPLEKKIIIKK